MQAKVVTFRDDDYPAVLRSIADAPVVLYVKGQLPTQGAIAIVGSRRASFYGIEVSAKFAVRLAESDFTVVSGMARGIDAAAHRGALRAKGTTVAVLGSGLSNIYPPEHRKLFEEIAASGAVISEFAMQTPPVPYNFPRRNRIISGLSLGVIVVEAAERSGALITADFALEQGREVFAVPGKIDQASSFGTHNLIKQGAKIVTCVEDVLEDLQPQVASLGTRGSKNRIAKMPMPGLSADEQKIYGYISDRPVHIDELTEQCGSSVPVMSVLLQLEIKHLVRQLPGKLFVR
jgi:DNA processing protein